MRSHGESQLGPSAASGEDIKHQRRVCSPQEGHRHELPKADAAEAKAG